MTTPVSYKLALLLREGNFDNFTCSGYYHLNEGYTNGYKYCYSEVDKQSEALLLAPTIAEVVMWLYEKYKIWISVLQLLQNGTDVLWYASCYEDGIGEDIETYYDSPTKAYEAAITYISPTIQSYGKTT